MLKCVNCYRCTKVIINKSKMTQNRALKRGYLILVTMPIHWLGLLYDFFMVIVVYRFFRRRSRYDCKHRFLSFHCSENSNQGKELNDLACESLLLLSNLSMLLCDQEVMFPFPYLQHQNEYFWIVWTNQKVSLLECFWEQSCRKSQQ